MTLRRVLVSLFLASSCALVNAELPDLPDNYDVLQYIDPLIGTANGGKGLKKRCRADAY